ncbi:MAG TPA: hypothetical protein H9819_04265 [Candidatus Bacteroides merdipullorum]|uniref:Uncharacterized protein n=1 Tax=Candidatus Bacteroides merdipullorum TaxID=2838474 RepID=A0A9D2A4Z9_9BACE|nr:hypothetical protein [Candidatus Bacteroides merdipullorum]
MKKLLVLWVVACGFMPLLWAVEGCEQRLTKEEFRAKQQAYITEKAGLTSEEATAFFPLYFELQDQKQQLNEEAWTLLREGKKDNVSEERYEEILNGVYEARISADRLEKSYFRKFRDILSCKKIYLVQQAEMRFHRELLKGMRGKGAPRRNVEK